MKSDCCSLNFFDRLTQSVSRAPFMHFALATVAALLVAKATSSSAHAGCAEIFDQLPPGFTAVCADASFFGFTGAETRDFSGASPGSWTARLDGLDIFDEPPPFFDPTLEPFFSQVMVEPWSTDPEPEFSIKHQSRTGMFPLTESPGPATDVSRFVAIGSKAHVSFRVSRQGEPTDHGNDPVSAQPIDVPSLTQGGIEQGDDTDWFTFSATAGTEYEFETVLGTLSDNKLRLIDTDGVTTIDEDNNGGVGLESEIKWTAPSNGTYFVQVLPYNSTQTGTYTLTVRSERRSRSRIGSGHCHASQRSFVDNGNHRAGGRYGLVQLHCDGGSGI